MMTFLPFADFYESAAALDTKRLQNQRTEARFVLEWLDGDGFDLRAYGAARMWRGYRGALAAYYNACLDAYEARGLKNGPTMGRRDVAPDYERPPWLGDARFHAAQRAQLLLKNPEFYGAKGWDASEPELGVEYVYPKQEKGRWVLYRRKNKKDLVLAEVHGDVVEAPAPKTRKRAAAAAPENTAPTRAEKVAPQKGPTRAAAPTGRSELVAEYTRLTKKALPALAKAHAWPIRFDHCFMRVMLDNAFGHCWYECLDRKKGSAISQIDEAALAVAVAVGRRMETEGLAAVEELDDASLASRGKKPKRRRRG